jgi:hypothetical protein
MKYPEDIDIFYILENHGWSTCYIYVGGEIYKMVPTHVFNNPIEVLLNGLSFMLQGDNETEFIWHDEPGVYKWEIKRNLEQRHKVQISITEYTKLQCDTNPKLETIRFEVKLKLFCLCVLKQMEKIRDLMTEKSFKVHRENAFPYQTLKDFQLAYENSSL